MSTTKKPAPNVPVTDADAQSPTQNAGATADSRRDFLAATAVTGIALGAGPSVSLAQDTTGLAPAAGGAAQGVVASPLPSGETFQMYDGTAAGAVLAQL